MKDSKLINTRNVLAFSSIVEMGTGVALVFGPALVAELLLGEALSAQGIAVARVAGIALLALGLACWPAADGSAAFRGMLVYNALVALYLAYLGAVKHMGGLLLWPAVAGHAVVALLLVWTRVGERRGGAAPVDER